MLDHLKLPSCAPVAIACSGGSDSMALTLAVAAIHPHVTALICDHGLRPESADEAQTTAARCKQAGITSVILPLHITADTAIQEQARNQRYEAMAQWCVAQHVPFLLTAHHADDQAETCLFRLLRHSGPDGLAGMSAKRNMHGITLVRPLLNCRKSELNEWLIENNVAWIEDPSNENTAFTRVRIRRFLQQQSHDAQSRLVALARQFGQQRIRHDALLGDAIDRFVTVHEDRLLLDDALLHHAQPLAETVLSRCLCYLSDNPQPPRGPDISRLCNALRNPDTKARSLHHCDIRREGNQWCIKAAALRLEKSDDTAHINRVENRVGIRHPAHSRPPLKREAFVVLPQIT